MKKKVISTVFFLLLISLAGAQMKTKADLILTHGKVYTSDPQSRVADAFAVKEGWFVSVGSTEQILRHFEADSVIDAGGRAVFPGFIDAHSHFFGYALNLQQLDLNGTGSFAGIIELLIEEKERIPGEWIVGRGWDQNLWAEKEFPDRMQLDILFPDRPVVLIRVDGHVVLANGEALRRAGIRDADGFAEGEVGIKNGWLTGILSENAADLMRNTIPKPTRREQCILLRRAQANCFESGLTGVADAGADFPVVNLYDSLQEEGILKMRIYAMLNPNEENLRNFIREGQYITSRLTVRSIKIYADGSLGSRTALLSSPYSDDPSKLGIQVNSREKIKEICTLALNNGYQMCTHAIGDSAVRLILDIYGESLKGKNDLRWRVEHAQVVDPSDLTLFGLYSIIPSIQATHATSDMKWAPNRLGKRRSKWTYAYKNLLAQNGWLANGTDFPIEKISPLLTFYSAVARQDVKGYPPGGFQPENALSREEALKSITLWAAKAGFNESTRGSIEKGKMADFVLLDHDIMTCPLNEIPGTKVITTVVGGEKVYE